MEMVLLTALGVGGATIIGSLIGFLFRGISHKFSDIVLSFAAGVMLSAAFVGLIMPSIEYGGENGIWMTILGIFAGAVCLSLIDKLVPHLHKIAGQDIEEHDNKNLGKSRGFDFYTLIEEKQSSPQSYKCKGKKKQVSSSKRLPTQKFSTKLAWYPWSFLQSKWKDS